MNRAKSRNSFKSSDVNKAELKLSLKSNNGSVDQKSQTSSIFVVNPFKMLKHKTPALERLEKKNISVDKFNLTGKILRPTVNNVVLPGIEKLKELRKKSGLDSDVKNVIYNYVKTRENNESKYVDESEYTDYFQVSLRESTYEENQKKKFDFLQSKKQANGKKDKKKNNFLMPLRYKPLADELTNLDKYKENLSKKQTSLKNSVVKLKSEYLEEKLENEKYKIRDYNFVNTLTNFKNGFFPKVVKPNIRVKVLSDSEINDPEKYSKKAVNSYDNFSRIYFNSNNHRRSNSNVINSRFFYASNMLKKNKEALDQTTFSSTSTSFNKTGMIKSSYPIKKYQNRQQHIKNLEINEIIEEGDVTKIVKLHDYEK